MRTWMAITALIFLTGCTQPSSTNPAYISEIDSWHAQRVERLRSDTGWLTLVGLHELKPGLNSVGSGQGMNVLLIGKAPSHVGDLENGSLGIIFRAEPTAGVTLHGDGAGVPVTKLLLVPDSAGEPTVLACGSLVFHVIDRQGRLFLRVKDRDSDVLAGFTGIDRFPVEARWRVAARLAGEAGTLVVPNVLGQQNEEPGPGLLVFELAGEEYRVSPTGRRGEGLFLVFADQTNGGGTYAGGRFLSIAAPDSNGAYVVDFNRAYNPPCVFTPFATCPLPAPENQLKVMIEAGEKMWGAHH
jgi:uncharacterized protein